jgi:hypothetical protein
VRGLALALIAATLLIVQASAAGEEVPDAQLLLDLDLLSQAQPQERDLMRRMSVVERLRLLEIFRFLESPPSDSAERRPPPATGGR